MTVKQAIAKIGERNPMAKLTPRNVRAIRNFSQRSNLKRGWKSALAKRYNVKCSTISNIVSGKSWKNLDEENSLFNP